jgi:hypothetical protein
MLQEQTIIGSPLAQSYVCFITQKADIGASGQQVC